MMEDRDYSEETAQHIDDEVKRIIEDCYARAQEILRKHAESVQQIVAVLLVKESLSSAEVQEILYGGPKPTTEEPVPQEQVQLTPYPATA